IQLGSTAQPDANGNLTLDIEDSRHLGVGVFALTTDPSLADFQSGLTYSWTITKNGLPYASGPGGLTFNNSANGAGFARNDYGFTPDSAGTYVVSVAFTDKDGSASASMTINVTLSFLPIPPPTVRLTNVSFP